MKLLEPARVPARRGARPPRRQGVAPLAFPVALLLAGALLGLPFSLDPPVARERLLGLGIAGALSLLALVGLRRLERVTPVLVAAAAVSLAGGAWVIAVTGPEVFRGPLGGSLRGLLRPLFGWVTLTTPVAVANTRFIVGYNGLADLCLVVAFAGVAILLARAGRAATAAAACWLVLSLALLVGTGSRGGLTGLVVGLWAVALVAGRRGWILVLASLPVVIALAALEPKGLDPSSTLGRITFWSDYLRLLAEYPLTGVGLGVDTANRVTLLYEVNPDPERIAYAHSTFVQAYLEQGPLGALGMLWVPLVAALAALLAWRDRALPPARRALLGGALGLCAGLEAHGLTDQVLTTNVGTALVLLALAAVVGALGAEAQRTLDRWVRRLALVTLAVGAAAVAGLLALPVGRAQLLLDLGGLQMVQGLERGVQASERGPALASAEATLALAVAQDPGHPAVLRDLARTRAARFDDAGALEALRRAAESPRVDPFDMLQIAHVYRDLGFANEAYAWATRAYQAWGRPPPDAVLLVYQQQTLQDNPSAQTLATQGEAALHARRFGEALLLFQQALALEPGSPYLQERVGAAARGIARSGR